MSTVNHLLEAALQYTLRNWAVFPIVPNKKTPLTPNGLKDASTDPVRIAKWFAHDANLAIRTGNGLVVLDIDVKKADGEATLQGWEAAHGPLPRTYQVRTPSGGKHFYFIGAAPTKAALGPGVDIRGTGGYVVAPPSVLPNGRYDVVDEVPLVPIPEWLVTLARQQPPQRVALRPGSRNVDLTSIAGSLRAKGLDATVIAQALTSINQTLSTPLPEAEVLTIAQSVGRYATADAPPWAAYQVPQSAKGRAVCNADTALGILERHPLFAEAIWFDAFRQRIMTTWEVVEPRPWTDSDTRRLLVFLQRDLEMRTMSKAAVEDAVEVFVRTRSRHEVQDWLRMLAWDQTPRLDTWVSTLIGSPDTPYTRAAGRNFWLGMMARVWRPPVQVDHMLVLEGPQGIGKTSALRALGGSWYLALNESVMSKDFFHLLPGHLLVEIAELDSFHHAEVTRIKQAISTPSDTFRPPYGRHPQTYHRSCVFVGTTNEDQYLRDPTGARRFWPVICGDIDLPALLAQREQLFAEAYALFKQGKLTWWEMPQEARDEQETRQESDVWEENIQDYLKLHSEVTITELLSHVGKPLYEQDRRDQWRMAAILRRHGWKRESVRIGGSVIKRWRSQERQPGEDAELLA